MAHPKGDPDSPHALWICIFRGIHDCGARVLCVCSSVVVWNLCLCVFRWNQWIAVFHGDLPSDHRGAEEESDAKETEKDRSD